MCHVSSPSNKGLTVPSIVSQSDKTGRRSYKMMRSMGAENLKLRREPVWPPICEEALLEGLRAYKPVSKSGRPLRRFVKRNVFISQHILRKTGKKRTAKQVGSRLQQISESSRDDDLKRLIMNRDISPESIFTEVDYNFSEPSSPSVLTSPADYTDLSSSIINFNLSKGLTPSVSSGTPTDVVDSVSVLSLDLANILDLTESGYGYSSSDSMSLYIELLSLGLFLDSTAQLGLDADITGHGVDFILSLNAQDTTAGLSAPLSTRKLSDIPSQSLFCQAPQLTIVSPFLSPHKSYFGTFGVYIDATKPVHSEIATFSVERAPSDCLHGTFVWRTKIIPGFWNELGNSPHFDRYTIVFDISELPSSRSSCTNLKSAFSVAFNIKSMSAHNVVCPSLYPAMVYDDPVMSFPYAFTPSPSSSSPDSLVSLASLQDSNCNRMQAWLESTSPYQSYAFIDEQTLDRQNSHAIDSYTFSPY